MPSRKVFKTL